MQKKSFGLPGRGGSSLKIRAPVAVILFAGLVVVALTLLIFSTRLPTRRHIVQMQFIGLSAFSGVRGGIHEFTSFFSRTALSVRELADLRQEHDALLQQLARMEELERTSVQIIQENARLREQLGFAETLRFNYIPARISGRDPSNLFSALVINRGRNAGVRENMAVIAWQGGNQALVGKVVQTGAFESLVMPVFDMNSNVSARFFVSRFEGIVEGRGSVDAPLNMRFIPRRAGDEISVGDVIVSSGMGGIFPPEINIGRVTGITFREHDMTIEADLETIIDFSRLEYVFLIEELPLEAVMEAVPAAAFAPAAAPVPAVAPAPAAPTPAATPAPVAAPATPAPAP
ncbi:MAG: rod shape-determining protein MreC, partial [Spirochaetes bacterium]|nr:rod shape-determining protein MreC [Spirochaetota bacterium]